MGTGGSGAVSEQPQVLVPHGGSPGLALPCTGSWGCSGPWQQQEAPREQL